MLCKETGVILDYFIPGRWNSDKLIVIAYIIHHPQFSFVNHLYCHKKMGVVLDYKKNGCYCGLFFY